jgi:phosphohistidine phosphatase
MKTISIVRHAKSSWEHPELCDFDRPLRNKGLRRTQKVCEVIKQMELLPDQILSSRAKRALKTSELLCENLGWNTDIIKGVDEFYPGNVISFINQIKMMDDRTGHLLIVGHNPGVTDLLNHLAMNNGVDWIPTSGFAVLTSDIECWSNVEPNEWKIVHYIVPKQILNNE